MKNLVFLTLLLTMLFLGTVSAEAADHFVRAGASGSANGTDWTNAYPTLPSALTRGDTYYIAGGTYAGRTFNTATNGAIPITIKKATVADHGTSTGWDDTFGNGTATFTSQIAFSTSNWVFDGQTGGGPSNWYGPFGFKVQVTAVSPAVVIGTINNFSSSVNGIELRHLEIQGNLDASGGGSVAQDGIGAGWGRHSGSISYYYIHDMGRTIFWISVSDFTVEYGVTGRYNAKDAQHSEIVSTLGVSGQFIFRYNLVTSVGPFPTTGGVMIDTSDGGSGHVYGNVFWQDPALGAWNCTNGGAINGWTGGGGEAFKNVFVYNNSFVSIASSSNPTAALGNSPATHSNNNARNNLYYNVFSAGGGSVWDVNSHNHFINTPTVGTNLTNGSGDPFVNLAGLDFHLKALTPGGFDVGAGPTGCTAGVNCYNVDMFKTVRGTDGTWDRGAVEFRAGGADVTPPLPPTNLAIQ